MPDISTVNGIDITTLASFGGVAFADGQTLDGQNVALVSDAWHLISTDNLSNDATSEFTSGIDSTYETYMFEFIGIHPVNDKVDFEFQVNRSGQTGWNEPIQSTRWGNRYSETSSLSGPSYDLSFDSANSTSDQLLTRRTGADSDQHMSGHLLVFNPASTTFGTIFLSRVLSQHGDQWWNDEWTNGYINTTFAIDEFRFQFNSGNMQSGTIKLYGLGHG